MILNKLKNTNILILIGILFFDAYLRLLQITHLFIWIEDYDEGAYSTGARFITHGYVPYKDFTLVHPPFYDLVLAAIYKIFGYNFFYGRYFFRFIVPGLYRPGVSDHKKVVLIRPRRWLRLLVLRFSPD